MFHDQLRRIVVGVAFLTCLTLMCDVDWLSAAEIHLKPTCKCERSVVRLGDMATIHSRDRRELVALSHLELFPAPAGRQSRTVTHYQVRDILEERGFDFRRIRLSGANSVQLSRAIDADYEPTWHHSKRSSTGFAKHAAADVNKTIQLVYAVRPLRRGDIVRLADVELQEVSAVKSAGDTYRDITDVVGQEVKQTLSPGDPIRATAVQAPILVRRGEAVTVVALAAGVRVKTEGRAVQQGSYGELITVESLADRKQKFSARVVDVQQVEVYAQSVAVR